MSDSKTQSDSLLMPTVVPGWYFLAQPDATVYGKILSSFEPDPRLSWLEYCNRLQRALVFVHERGWMTVYSEPGIRAEVHGGGWGEGQMVPRSFMRVLREFAKGFEWRVAVAKTSNETMKRILSRLGWIKVGIDPLSEMTADGPVNTTVFVLDVVE